MENYKIFAKTIEPEAIEQILQLASLFPDEKIRVMPDCHVGSGCTIGTTMSISNKICPNTVGVDIGCNMFVVKLSDREIDLEKLDDFINEYIPSGFDTHNNQIVYFPLRDLRCFSSINADRAKLSIGTLGGGNHFIEIDSDDKGALYLVVHSGSRNLGANVCKHYQGLAYIKEKRDKPSVRELVFNLKKQGREREISSEIKKIQEHKPKRESACLVGDYVKDYLHDMNIVQQYAKRNTETIASLIVEGLGLSVLDSFHSTHNYIDIDNMILRKGACSAKKGERLIIPLNMRDGSLICEGKGNADWNFSAPHGAGRIMSRGEAKKTIKLDDYKESMKGIFSSCVNKKTLDEAPMAYKLADEIIEAIKPTAEIITRIKPIYNFKSN